MMKAKKKLTRLWSILLVLVMLVGLLPTTALAADATAVFIHGDNSEEALALLGSGASWNGDTNTLTLDGVNFTTEAAIAVQLPADATIELNGNNTIKGGNSDSGDCYGIYVPEGNLTISGSGTLNVTAGNASSRSCGIYAVNGEVLINSGTVNANGGAAGGASFGIYSKNNINISGTADVTGKGGTATGDGSFGISAEGEVIISGGKVTAIGGTGRGSDGIYSGKGIVTISDGKVTAIGGTVTEGWSVGIFAQKSSAHLQISGGADVTAIGGSSRDTSCGIYSAQKVTISGGTVNAYGGTATNNSYGINSINRVTFAGGTLTAAAKGDNCINRTLNDTSSGAKTISFDKNGGSGEMIAYTYADSYTLPANGFTPPADKEFMGWSESSTGEVIETTTINATVGKTLYAIWKNNAADFTVGNGTAALALLNEAKTGAADSVWDSTTNTLTLNGVNFTATAATAVKLPAGSKIVLKGVNTIKGGGSNSDHCYGIYAQDSLTISGTGTLNVTSGTTTYSECNSYGIYVVRSTTYARGNLTISGSGTLNVTGGATTGRYSNSYGIYASNNVIIEGGIVSAQGGTATGGSSYGICAYYEEIKISGGTVNANGGEATNGNSYGTYSGQYTEISGGTITGTGGAAHYSCGIRAANSNGYISVSGGTITGTGGAANYSDGICTKSYISVSGGTITGTGGAANYSNGICTESYISVSGGTITGTGGTADEASYGIYLGQNITIEGGTVIAKANTSALITDSYALPTAYQWRTSESGDYTQYTQPSDSAYTWNAADTYLEIKELYTVTVTNGTASVSKAAAGTTVTLNANKAPDGQVFDKWVVESGGITLADATSATTTFTMPAKAVSVKATYKANPAAPTYSIALSPSGTQTFTAATVGYGAQTAKTITVSNTGTGATGALTVALSGSNTSSFELNKTSIADIAVSGSDTFTVVPKTGLSAGTYTATVTVSGGNSISASFNVSFTVNPAATTGGGGGSYTPPTYKVESEVSKDADGSVSFSKSSAKKGDTVTITVTPDRYYKVDSVTVKDKNGKEIAVTDNGDGTFTFKMPDSKVAVEPVFSWDNPFTDVDEEVYYAPAVEWALKNGVTGGVDDTHFAPNAPCTRAQIVTFLWRAAGCPEPAGANSFTDVSADAYYAKAVAWAVEQGITNGTGDGKFSPDAVCTRSQSMAFIYRSEQAQGGGMQGEWMFLNPFADVNLDDYYGEAVMWAVANGVTSGTSDTTFSPNATCTRGQIVTFLYRFFVK